LFTDPARREFFFELWCAIARRYRGRFPNLVFERFDQPADRR